MTVGELMHRSSRIEILWWMAYERKNGPLGPRRGDFQAALVATVIAQANSKKGKKAKFEDFLLKWGVVKRDGVENESFDD